MSKGLEIAAARFAAGEIDEEQYRTIVATLSESGKSAATASEPIGSSGGASLSALPWKQWAAWAFVIVVGVALVRGLTGGGGSDAGPVGGAQAGLHINNLRSSGFFGDIITGTALNEGEGSNVWVWIEVGGVEYCPRRAYLPARSSYKFEIRCHELISVFARTSTFTATISRSPTATVRAGATSL